MADEIQFVDGLIVKAPHPKAPEFVKAGISINVASLSAWLAQQQGEWINVDVKVSGKSGKWYAAVSNFKPKESNPNQERSNPKQARPADKFEDMDDSIPF